MSGGNTGLFGSALPSNALSGSMRTIDAEDLGLTSAMPAIATSKTNLLQISLGGNLLTGTLPDALRNQTDLESLSLRDNLLEGSIPDGAWAMYPSACSLQNNRLVGSIPAEWEFKGTLLLQNNMLTGNIPAWPSATAAQELDLSHNSLSGIIPADWAATVKSIDLSHNSLTGSIPAAIGEMAALEVLRLDNNLLSGGLSSAVCTAASSACAVAPNPLQCPDGSNNTVPMECAANCGVAACCATDCSSRSTTATPTTTAAPTTAGPSATPEPTGTPTSTSVFAEVTVDEETAITPEWQAEFVNGLLIFFDVTDGISIVGVTGPANSKRGSLKRYNPTGDFTVVELDVRDKNIRDSVQAAVDSGDLCAAFEPVQCAPGFGPSRNQGDTGFGASSLAVIVVAAVIVTGSTVMACVFYRRLSKNEQQSEATTIDDRNADSHTVSYSRAEIVL